MCVFSEKSVKEEERLGHEHREEMSELHTDLHEKDEKIEELVDDYEVQLQVVYK